MLEMVNSEIIVPYILHKNTVIAIPTQTRNIINTVTQLDLSSNLANTSS